MGIKIYTNLCVVGRDLSGRLQLEDRKTLTSHLILKHWCEWKILQNVQEIMHVKSQSGSSWRDLIKYHSEWGRHIWFPWSPKNNGFCFTAAFQICDFLLLANANMKPHRRGFCEINCPDLNTSSSSCVRLSKDNSEQPTSFLARIQFSKCLDS